MRAAIIFILMITAKITTAKVLKPMNADAHQVLEFFESIEGLYSDGVNCKKFQIKIGVPTVDGVLIEDQPLISIWEHPYGGKVYNFLTIVLSKNILVPAPKAPGVPVYIDKVIYEGNSLSYTLDWKPKFKPRVFTTVSFLRNEDKHLDKVQITDYSIIMGMKKIKQEKSCSF